MIDDGVIWNMKKGDRGTKVANIKTMTVDKGRIRVMKDINSQPLFVEATQWNTLLTERTLDCKSI